MSAQDCIRMVAQTIGIDEAEAKQAYDSLRQRYEAKRNAGFTIDEIEADMRQHAAKLGKQAQVEAAIARKMAALNVLARDNANKVIEGFLADGLKPHEAVRAVLVGITKGVRNARRGIGQLRNSYDAKWSSGLANELLAEVPELLKMQSPFQMLQPGGRAASTAFQDDIVREMREAGSTKNLQAQRAAKIFSKYYELARISLNKLGANIGKLEGYSPQSHDPLRILRAGADEGQARAVWKRDLLNLLDLERSFDADDPAEIDRILDEIFTTVTTGRDAAITPFQKGQRASPANMARSMSRHRELHFKDANSWIEYRSKYGRGHLIEASLDFLHRAARRASVMHVLGPNPEMMLRSIVDDLTLKIRNDPNLSAAYKAEEIRKLTEGMSESISPNTIGAAFKEATGGTNVPGNIHGYELGQGFRTLQSLAKLGGAMLSSFTDLSTMFFAMRFQGNSLAGGLERTVKALFQPRTADKKEFARRLGLGVQAIVENLGGARYADDQSWGVMGRLNNAMFQLQGLTWWTDKLQQGFATISANDMAIRGKAAYSDLDAAYKNVLGIHGLGEREWEVIRKLPRVTINGEEMIDPDQIAHIDDKAFDSIVADDLAAAEVTLRRKLGLWNGNKAKRLLNNLTKREAHELNLIDEMAKLQADPAAPKSWKTRAETSIRWAKHRLAKLQPQIAKLRDEIQTSPDSKTDTLPQAALDKLAQRRQSLVDRARSQLELDLRAFFLDEADFAVVHADDRTRMFTKLGTRPGTVVGEVIRAIATFKTFPVAYSQKIIGRARWGGPGGSALWKHDLPGTSVAMALALALGYVSVAARDISRNREPRKLTPATLLAVALQSGGLGIYGDFLFGARDRFGAGPVADLGGPIGSTIDSLWNLTADIRDGDFKSAKGDAVRLFLDNAPFINLWYLRGALDLGVIYSLQEMVSPGYLDRREADMEKQFGSGFLISP